MHEEKSLAISPYSISSTGRCSSSGTARAAFVSALSKCLRHVSGSRRKGSLRGGFCVCQTAVRSARSREMSVASQSARLMWITLRDGSEARYCQRLLFAPSRACPLISLKPTAR